MCDGSGNNTNLVNQAAVSYMLSKGRSNPFQKDRWCGIQIRRLECSYAFWTCFG